MAGMFHRFSDEDDDEMRIVVKSDSNGEDIVAPSVKEADMSSRCCSTKNARCHVIVIFILSITVLALAISLAVTKIKVVNHYEEVHADDDSVCKSHHCFIAAGEIMAKIDFDIDPCDDFYQYSCGNFIENKFMQPSDTYIDQPTILAEETTQILHQELICNTDKCIVAAGEILSQMNMTAKPCEDFYNYACGNFVAKKFLRPAENKLNVFKLLSEDNSKLIFQELTDDNKTRIFGKTSSALANVKRINKLCMNVTQLQKDGHAPLLKAIEKFGSWGITNSSAFNPDTWNFTEQLQGLQLYGFSPLFSVTVDADEKNSSVNVINLFQHGLTLSSHKDYNISVEQNKLKKKAFSDYGVEVARLLGTEENVSRPIMDEIYTLESRLAEIYVLDEIIRDPNASYNKISVADSQAFFGSHFSLESLLNVVTNRTDITSDYKLITSTTNYFRNLTAVLDEYLQPNKKRIMNNYMTWYMVHRTIGDLGSDFQFAQLILTSVTVGTKSIDERWKICTAKMDSLMGRVTGAMFIEGRFDTHDRDAVTEIVNSVKNSLVGNLPGYTWMDDKTAKAAIDKAIAITTRIGFPDYITNASAVDEHYKDFVVKETLYDTIQEYRKWARKLSSAKLDKPTDPNEWQMTASEVNAYYHPLHNNVVLPAGILRKPFYDTNLPLWQMTASEVNAYYHPLHNNVVLPAGILRKPFYDTNLPLAWNYGGMGSVIGHEISHGFDDQGSQYDKEGNLVNWWTDYSSKAFKKSTKCFVDQYSNYKVAGTPVNGVLCLGENIADNGGVALSYKAYQQRLKDSGEKPLQFPGLSLNDRQLFFLSFAQIWCMKSTPEYDQSSLNYNPHSPSKFRVQGTYSNSEGFNEAFQCKEGSPYNPPKKCKLW